jgi:nitroreductase
MTLYETIFVRRSVRKFDLNPLDSSTVETVTQFIADTPQLIGQSARFELVSADKVHGGAAAPHYILAYCEENDSAYANVGYVLQKVDLYLQSIGLGSVWLGMAKPNEPGQGYCILLAFGKTDIPLRVSEKEFERLPVEKISDQVNTIAEAARLAPSAVNSQPWKLHFDKGKVVIQYFGRGAMKLMLRKKLSKIDLGIVTRHVEIALLQEGKTIQGISTHTNGKSFEMEVTYS